MGRIGWWLATLTGCVLGLGSIPAFGSESPDKGAVVAHVTLRGHDVPVYAIGVIEAPNTPAGQDGFAEKVAGVLYAWTHTHQVEANGNICHTPDGQRWGTVLLTIYAHTDSPRTYDCPSGMVAAGVDIHSHPQHVDYEANGVDELFLDQPAMSRVVTVPDTFSGADFARPGYMVGLRGLHFEDGPARHVREVKKMYLRDLPNYNREVQKMEATRIVVAPDATRHG